MRSPLERRLLFLGTPGQRARFVLQHASRWASKKMRMEVQSTPLCLGVKGPTPCVENRRWTMGGVTFVTMNIQGSCNNLCDTNPDPAELAARNTATIRG